MDIQASYNRERKEGEIDLCDWLCKFLTSTNDNITLNGLKNSEAFKSILDKNPIVQRLILTGFLKESIFKYKVIDDTVDVVNLLKYLPEEGELHDWLACLQTPILPFFKDTELFSHINKD